MGEAMLQAKPFECFQIAKFLDKLIMCIGQGLQVRFELGDQGLLCLNLHQLDLVKYAIVNVVAQAFLGHGLVGVLCAPLFLAIPWLIYFALIRSFRHLGFQILPARQAGGEFDEEEGHAGVGEESLFRLLAVLVHGVSDQVEIHLRP